MTDNKEPRRIDINEGNYNERIEGNYIQGNYYEIKLNLRRENKNYAQFRQKFLEYVTNHVQGLINTSLYNRVYVIPEMDQNPEQIESPLLTEVKVNFQRKITLKDTEIINVFDQPEVAGRLLILGQPGTGKTTILYKLALELVKRANDNFNHPIPVLFSLSFWKNDNQSIKDWLINELKDKYGVRKDIANGLVDDQEIIPLLDGLDELAAERQENCVIKINEFLQPSNWTNPVVVCSRIQEYERYEALLQLNNSIELCPLSQDQIYQYLLSTDNLQLWDSISHDSDLSQLAKTPLLLNIIVLSAEEISIQTWQQFKSSEERLSYLFNAYISMMLKRHYKDKKPYQDEKTQRWLNWLAQRLIEKSTTEFFIERMQPDWLKDTHQKIIYSCILSGVTGVLIFGLIYGEVDGGFDGVIYGLIYGLIYGVIYGLIYGLTYGEMENHIQPVKKSNFFKDSFLFFISDLISINILNLFFRNIKTIFGFSFLEVSMLIALLLGYDIIPFEISGFSLKKFLLLIGSVTFFIVLCLVNYVWPYKWINVNVVIYGLIIGLINGIILISRIKSVEIESKNLPNQGICKSITSTILISAITFVFVALGTFILKNREANNKLEQALIPSLVQGLFFGLLIAIPVSGIPAIKHFVLRIFLWSSGYIPWNYAKFLNYCTNRLFLQRVGGSYRFMHDLLRQHFAKSYYNQAIKLNPNANAYIGRGNLSLNKEDYDSAIADYNQALKLDPNYAYAYIERGNAYFNNKEYDSAIADYNQALKLDSSLAIAYNNRGNAYLNNKEYDSAIADYNQALKLDSNYTYAYYNRGLAYGNKKDYDRAIADYNQAIKLDPNYANAYIRRGLAYGNKKDYDRAIADYNQAIKLDPNYANAYYGRGLICKNQGNKDKAIEDFKKFLELSNDVEWNQKAKQHLQELGTF